MITSLLREEVVAAFKEADLFLFPSRIECSPLVLFGSVASRTPFLTTDVGNAREIIEWTGAGSLLPAAMEEDGNLRADIHGSVEVLEGIYYNQADRYAMAETGFREWRNKYTWRKIAGHYEELYKTLVNI